eukprot:6486745-Amphidinium_carterae.1
MAMSPRHATSVVLDAQDERKLSSPLNFMGDETRCLMYFHSQLGEVAAEAQLPGLGCRATKRDGTSSFFTSVLMAPVAEAAPR